MFVLRSISCGDGETKNESLGNEYTIIREGDVGFKERHDQFWNVDKEYDIKMGRNMFDNTSALITSESGKIIPVMKHNFNFIVYANGQTFEKI